MKIIHYFLPFILCFQMSVWQELQAQSCKQAVQMARPLIQAFRSFQHLSPKEQYLQAKQKWLKKLASQPGQQGVKYLGKDKRQSGQLWSQSQKHYISLPILSESAKLNFVLTGGKGKVGIRICQVNQEGLATNMEAIVLNEETGSEGKRFNLKNTKGKILVVSLKNYGARGALSYRLSME